ncbi:Fur family transcriptional regulator, zinc uptake regulator [Malonomonas rubra DSM 5091]|uniref:Fur family transcriptional regulator, zinc uptake regulator n=1 Tax=Malonomonas rubra DSM 5091 TaxID=1122189 RepID=A0A1M6GH29_MALRU|nr:transcriptional repressor [Malonomonas rubra]SHJ09276.1 Fur family transcriptional regulator, zinc uptake regulator [Malonomonas rubra DSM 5091]
MSDPSATMLRCAQGDHQLCIKAAINKAEQLCAQQNQRFTAIRRRVLELVWRQHKPIGAYEVLDLLQKENRTAPPTVYRALDFLQQMGLVHRIESLNAYVGCSHPEHPHDGQFLICKQCHSMAELDIPEVADAIEKSAAASGFIAAKKTIEVIGLCSACRNRTDNA